MRNSRTSIFLFFMMAGMISAFGSNKDLNKDLLEYQLPSYGVGRWQYRNFGNHRALVTVSQPAGAVKVLIPWRRPDKDPEKKAVLVFDPQGKEVLNSTVIHFSRDAGEVVFEAKSAGDYAVYYMPFTMGNGLWDDNGTYIPPKNKADKQWLESLVPKSCPSAALKGIQAVAKFHRFDPMEIVPTEKELKLFKERYGNPDFMLFPEDRLRPIRMLETIPVKFLLSGPEHEFTGQAQPDEYYPLQIGVWASGANLKNLDVSWSNLSTADGKKIAAKQITCINTEGRDIRGKYFRKTVSVDKGRVQPLWLIINVPADAKGVYHGTVAVKAENLKEQQVAVTLKVDGEPVPFHGVGDSWRMSRLAWLNSDIGIDNDSLPPFKPLELKDNSIALTLSEVRFSRNGLPEQITTNGRNLLTAPVSLQLINDAGHEISLRPAGTKTLLETPARVERATDLESDDFSANVNCLTDQDGMLQYSVTIKTGDKNISLKDLSILLPVDADVARYEAGFGVRGCEREKNRKILWKWPNKAKYSNNFYWAGDVNYGIQLWLSNKNDDWINRGCNVEAWNNSGKGGAEVYEKDNTLYIRAFTGADILKKNSEYQFRFRLMLTPSKPLSATRDRWFNRYAGKKANILNYLHAYNGNSYINFPFIEPARRHETVQKALDRHDRFEKGSLEYDLQGKLSAASGAVTTEVRSDFTSSRLEDLVLPQNQTLWKIEYANGAVLRSMWRADMHAFCLVLLNTKKPRRIFQLPGISFNKNTKYKISLEWSDNKYVLKINGKPRGTFPVPEELRGTVPKALCYPTSLWSIGEVRIGNFVDRAGKAAKISGSVEVSDNFAEIGGKIKHLPQKTQIYYTLRELTNYTPELWALRSLGDEVIEQGSMEIYALGKVFFKTPGGGDPWLQEHLRDGYVPAWRNPLETGYTDAAISLRPANRFQNLYLEGVNYLMRKDGITGIYLDGVGFGRDIARRLVRIMYSNDPNFQLELHLADPWHRPGESFPSSAIQKHLEHIPYMRHLWLGEYFNYSRKPDYFMTEVSGLPFGMMSEMLDSGPGTPLFRGMVYGMIGRQNKAAPAMYNLWDEFNIANAKMYGYWDADTPVKCANPEFKVSSYSHFGEKALIAIGHWPGEVPRNRYAVAGKRRNKIVIDGNINGDEWQNSAQLSGFVNYLKTGRALSPTRVWITYDNERLYIAFRCLGQNGHALKAAAKQRDDQIWNDDAMEFLIQPDPKQNEKFYHFIGNSQGIFFDSCIYDKNWNGDWEYKVSRDNTSWSGELSVSWSALGVENNDFTGYNIALNVLRDIVGGKGLTYSTWSPAKQIHDTSSFGLIKFEPETRLATAEERSASEASLQIDYEKLGLDPANLKAYLPKIENLQEYTPVNIAEPIKITPGTGALIIVETFKKK